MKKHTKRTLMILTLALAMLLSACQPKEAEQSVSEPTETSVSESKEALEGALTGEGIAKGFGGDVKASVTVEGKDLTAVTITADDETPTIGGKAAEELAKAIEASNSIEVDSVSGATVTSEAVKEAVKLALEAAGVKPEDLDAKAVEGEAMELDQEADVVVVGAGGAGLTAAIKAADEGLSVIIVEKAGNTGGNTNRATGGMNAADTHYQKEQGIEDDVETYIADTMKGGHDKNNPDLVEILAEESNDAIEWLDSIGANLSDVGLAGGATNERAHRPVDENGKILSVGTYLVEKLTAQAEKVGVKIIYKAKVNEILMDGDKVSGVTAETAEGTLTVKAKAVIVASGGFGGSDELVSKYRPELQGYVSTNAPEITGDAIAFLEKIGAAFVDMDQIQTHPTVVQKDGSLVSESLRGDGAILLNKEGKRFTDEMQTRDYVSNKINEQTDKTAWLIVDEVMFEESNVVKKYVDRGLLTKADDFAALADVIGCDATEVEKSITTWAAAVDAGVDEEFDHKNLDKMSSNLKEGPYYIGPVGPGIHHTMGGVKINTEAQVINTEDAPIPGLFAAGEVTGGVHGGNRLGGNAVTDIVVFGGIAGENAAEYVNEN